MNQAALALLAVTLATFINSLGYIFYKFAHIRMEKNRDSKQYYFLTWQFICGSLLILLGAAINVVALAYADQMTLTSTSSLTLVFNSILATSLLGEVFTRYDLISILLISIGASVCVVLSNYQPILFTIPTLVERYTSPQSILLMIFTVLIIIYSFKLGERVIQQIHNLYEEATRKGELLETFLRKERSDVQEEKILNQNRQSLIKHFSFEEENIGSPRSQSQIPHESESERIEQISRFRSQIQRPQNDFDQVSNSNTYSIYNATTDKDGSQMPFKTTQQTQIDFVRNPTYNSMKDDNDKGCEKCPKYDVGGQAKGCNDEPTITQLIDRISKMDEKDLKKLSPNFQKFWIRLPLILYPWASGLLSGMTTSFMKGVAETMKNHTFYEMATHPLPYICLVICGFNIIGQLYTLNTGLKFYNQLEVIPIYQSSVILNNLLCGGLIFNEFQYYSWWNMLLIGFGSVTCICGIMIIAKKYQFISTKEAEKSVVMSESKDTQIDMIFFSQNGSDERTKGDLQGHYQRI